MNKKLLCAAVGASLAAATGLAQAENHLDAWTGLVPYVVKDASRTTVVTVIMSSHQYSKSETLHLQYQTKSTTDANTAACLPSSVEVPVTDNDIVTWDTAGILGYPLFGDTTNPAPLGVSISYAAPRHGYLMVESPRNRDGSEGNEINAIYWLELDLANGGAHGDVGIFNNRDNDNFDRNGAGYTSGYLSLRPNSSLSDNGNSTAVAFWPTSVASTVFTVTPLGSAMLTKENNQVILQVANDDEVQGAYDRNENGVDGTVPITVRCVGRVTPAQLMPGVVANAAWAAQGGWGFLTNLGDNNANNGSGQSQGGTNGGDLSAVVYQVDSSSAAGKFISNATRITTWQE